MSQSVTSFTVETPFTCSESESLVKIFKMILFNTLIIFWTAKSFPFLRMRLSVAVISTSNAADNIVNLTHHRAIAIFRTTFQLASTRCATLSIRGSKTFWKVFYFSWKNRFCSRRDCLVSNLPTHFWSIKDLYFCFHVKLFFCSISWSRNVQFGGSVVIRIYLR